MRADVEGRNVGILFLLNKRFLTFISCRLEENLLPHPFSHNHRYPVVHGLLYLQYLARSQENPMMSRQNGLMKNNKYVFMHSSYKGESNSKMCESYYYRSKIVPWIRYQGL